MNLKSNIQPQGPRSSPSLSLLLDQLKKKITNEGKRKENFFFQKKSGGRKATETDLDRAEGGTNNK